MVVRRCIFGELDLRLGCALLWYYALVYALLFRWLDSRERGMPEWYGPMPDEAGGWCWDERLGRDMLRQGIGG
jgi:hypothetical protein